MALQKDTQIQIDNTKPQYTSLPKNIENGKVEFNITAKEKIRPLDGWNIENNMTLKKVFRNNVAYTTHIQDLAGNCSDVKIEIISGTNIFISYGCYNSAVGWSIVYGNDEIAGKQALMLQGV